MPVRFFQRTFPSANMVLIQGSYPVLIDTGFGSDIAETGRLLRDAGTPPEALSLIVNTHYHADHSGGNADFQSRYGIPIAAHRWEAAIVNARDADACSARWLGQRVDPYRVDTPLSDGDEIPAGDGTLRAVHTPGHTLGHISLYLPDDQILICGDSVHGDDAAWIGPFREGAGALLRAMESLDRLAALPLRWACSGHGAAIADPYAAIASARRRYNSWLADPRKLGWHALKRIFTYALMLFDGLSEAEIPPYLLARGWFADYSRWIFDTPPGDFVQPLLAEMLRSGAAEWRDGKLYPRAPYVPPPPGWNEAAIPPASWPR